MINKTRLCRLNIFVRPIFHFFRGKKSAVGSGGRLELDISRQAGRLLPPRVGMWSSPAVTGKAHLRNGTLTDR